MYVVSAGTFDRIPPVTLYVLRLAVGLAVLPVFFPGRTDGARRRGSWSSVRCLAPPSSPGPR